MADDFIRGISAYPRLQALARKYRRAFSGLDLQAALRILGHYDLDDEDFNSPGFVTLFATLVRMDVWRTAYQHDDPPWKEGLAFAEALAVGENKERQDLIEIRVLQSGNRRLDGLAHAIADYEEAAFPGKFAAELDFLGIAPEEISSMAMVSPLLLRLREGVRARHLEKLFGRHEDDPADAMRLMLRHFGGYVSAQPLADEAAKTMRTLKAAGLLDMEGKPDYLPPARTRSVPVTDLADRLTPAHVKAAAALGLEYDAWREANPGSSHMDFSIPEVLRHADLLALHEAGVVKLYHQTTGLLDEYGVEVDFDAPYVPVWGLSERAGEILHEIRARADQKGPEEGADPAVELVARLQGWFEGREKVFQEERGRYQIEVADDFSEGARLSVRWEDEGSRLTVSRYYKVEVVDGVLNVERHHRRRNYDRWYENEGPQEKLEAALEEIGPDSIVAGCSDSIVERKAWKAALGAARSVLAWQRAADDFDRKTDELEALRGKAAHIRREIASKDRRRKGAGGLPEEKVDSSLGVLRMRACDGKQRLIEVSPSNTPSRRRADGSLAIDPGDWLVIDCDGNRVGRRYSPFRGISPEDGTRILRITAREYLERRPAAFEEALLDEVLNEIPSAEIDLDKSDDAETVAWDAMLSAIAHAQETRAVFATVDAAAAQEVPEVHPPEDPYDRNSGEDGDEDLEGYPAP